MPEFAPAALATAVALSALGAVTLCVLVVLYGFTPAGEEPPGEAAHRLLVTRVGHALAAACFTATAILIAVVLVRPAPPSTPTPAPVSETVPDARVPALGEQVAGQEKRLSETEVRLKALEDAMRRRPVETRSETKAGTKRVESSRVVEPTAPSASPVSSAASTPAPPMTWAPTAPPPAVVAPAPASPPAPVPAPVAAAPRAAQPEATAPPAEPARRQGFDLRSKLREDWRDIRRGVGSAGDDFRRAIDGVKRGLE
jgi:hypothetical protein